MREHVDHQGKGGEVAPCPWARERWSLGQRSHRWHGALIEEHKRYQLASAPEGFRKGRHYAVKVRCQIGQDASPSEGSRCNLHGQRAKVRRTSGGLTGDEPKGCADHPSAFVPGHTWNHASQLKRARSKTQEKRHGTRSITDERGSAWPLPDVHHNPGCRALSPV